jgi:glycosyltransferase involved in cell wall biosynthesis
MKILLAAASWAANISGLQRHAFNVARCLLLRPEVTELHIVVAPWQRNLLQAAGVPPDPRASIHVAEIKMGSLSRNRWHYRELPRLAARLCVDVVHLTYPVPVNAAAFDCPTIVTLHDLYPYEIPGNFGFPKYIFNRAILKQCLRAVDSIACVSEATRLRLKQYAPHLVWRKSVRIYNCVELSAVCAAPSPIPNWQDEPFLLCVAQHRRNKNLPLLIRAFDLLLRSGQIDPLMKLVIVGIKASQTDAIHQLVSACGRNRDVQFLEGLSDPELHWCYRHCAALAAPSITEGFGLPVAEALLAGCRIVCSDIPAHREIADGLCTFVTLRDNQEEILAEAILAALKQPRRPALSLPQFSHATVAGQYTDLYRELIASRIPAGSSIVSSSIKMRVSGRQSV